MKKFLILSNNPMVLNKYPMAIKVDGVFKDVLIKGRDFIHRGCRLINHPLAGSVKPNETIYKTLLLASVNSTLDYNSVQIIESAIEVTNRFQALGRNWDEKTRLDFQLIDWTLFETAFQSLQPEYRLEH